MRKNLMTGVLVLMLIANAAPALAHTLYSIPKEMPISASCRVFVDGQEATVMDTAVNLTRVWTSRPPTTLAPVVRFAMDGTAKLAVRFNDQIIEKVVVRPLALGIELDYRRRYRNLHLGSSRMANRGDQRQSGGRAAFVRRDR